MQNLQTLVPDGKKFITLPEEVGLYKSCRKNPAALYVCRHGVYLPNLCVKCWRKGDPGSLNKRNYAPGSVKTGRS